MIDHQFVGTSIVRAKSSDQVWSSKIDNESIKQDATSSEFCKDHYTKYDI